MSGDPGGIGSRFMNLCVGLLLAAMALYGAVAIIKAIWVPLCIVIAVVAASVAVIWLIVIAIRSSRANRW